MKYIFYIFLFTISISSCAIRYQPLSNTAVVSDAITSTAVHVLKSTANQRLLKKWQRKGLRYYQLSIHNSSDETLLLDEKHLLAISDLEKKKIVTGLYVLDKTRFNKGLFYTVIGASVVAPFGFVTKPFRLYFYTNTLVFTLPLMAYGIVNGATAIKSTKVLQKDIAAHYLLGLSIAPKSSVEGFVLVKSNSPVFFQLRDE